MRKTISLFLFVVGFNSFSQNKAVLYDFAGLPQTLLLNPGLETNYKYHIGVPLLSGFSTDIGITGFTVSDVFAIDNASISDKISAVLQNLDNADYLKINSQIEVFSAGFRWDKKTYISFGFYQELDAIVYFPKDFITLFNEGNSAYLNKNFSISQLAFKLDLSGVLHAGITKKVSDELTVGGRFKIYSSALNIESTNNTGTFTTSLGSNNIYVNQLNNINFNQRSSGVVAEDENTNDPTKFLKNTFLGDNSGVGLDFGLTYHINPQLQFSGSILDVGFVHHKKNIKNAAVEGSFVFEGIEFEYDSSRSYWQELDATLKEQIVTSENQESYISWRPTRINTAIKYSFGEKRSKFCYDNISKDFYTDAFGVQLYSIFRPVSLQFAATSFYEKSFSKKMHAKVTYTVDDYSYSNIGVGVSFQLWKINFYGILDNVLELSDISKANGFQLQFGFNLLFN